MGSRNYFIEVNSKNSNNNNTSSVFTTDYQPFLIKSGSTVTCSSCFINSIGAGDLISINESGDFKDNECRLTFCFYCSNDALNLKREGYNFNSDKNIFEYDVDNKPMLLYTFEKLGQTVASDNDYFDYMMLIKESVYLPSLFYGNMKIPKMDDDRVATNNMIQIQADYTIYKPNATSVFIPILCDLVIDFENITANSAYLQKLIKGTYVFLQHRDGDHFFCGFFQILHASNTRFIVKSDTSQVNQYNLNQFMASPSTAVIGANVNICYSVPCVEDPNVDGGLFCIPTIPRRSINSSFLESGTVVNNYLFGVQYGNETDTFFTNLNSINQVNTILGKLFDDQTTTNFYSASGVLQGAYTTTDNSIAVTVSNANEINAITPFEESDTFYYQMGDAEPYHYGTCYIELGGGSNVFANFMYKNLGVQSDSNLTKTDVDLPLGTKFIFINIRSFLASNYFGVHLNTNNNIYKSKTNVNPTNGYYTGSIITPYTTETNNNIFEGDKFNRRFVVNHDAGETYDFTIRYGYKDISIQNLSYVSPSDLATNFTQQTHVSKDALDNTGSPIAGSVNKGIPQNEFLIPIWFPYNTKIDPVTYLSTDFNLPKDAGDPTLLELSEPDEANLYYYTDDGIAVYGMLNNITREGGAKRTLPIGTNVFIHKTFNIPNTAKSANLSNKYYFVYPCTKKTYFNIGDMTTNGKSSTATVYEDGVNISDSTETNYATIFSTQIEIGFPIQYIPNNKAYCSQLCGVNNLTLSFNEDISKFSIDFASQPYTTPYNTSTESGGDNATIIYFPSLFHKDNLTRLGGIIFLNYFGKIINFGSTIPISSDYVNPLDYTYINPVAQRFFLKLGFTYDNLINNYLGYSYDNNGQLIVKGSTDGLIDSADGLITEADNGVNNPRYIEANFYKQSAINHQDAPAQQAKYEFSSLTGQGINNASLGYALPNTSGTGDLYDVEKFTEDVDIKNKNNINVRVSEKDDFNPLASQDNPDRQRNRFFIVKTSSTQIIADKLPQKVEEPYFIVLCDLVDDGSYITATLSKNPIVAFVSKLNSALDYFYSYVSPVSFTMQSDKLISSITVEIVDSNLNYPSLLSPNSVIIFQVEEPFEYIPYIPTIPQIQYQQLAIEQQLEKKEPQKMNKIKDMIEAELFPQPANYLPYELYIKNNNTPISKAKYSQLIRQRKKASDQLELANKIYLISQLVDLEPENIGLQVFDSLNKFSFV